MKKSLRFLTVIFFLLSSMTYPQSVKNNSLNTTSINLKGKHSLFLQAGFKINSSSSVQTTITDVEAETNVMGCIGYQYWFDPEWSVNVSTGIFNAESNVNLTNISSIAIIPVLFGFSYYPEALSLGTVGRIYFGINTGIYTGSGTKTNLNFSDFGTSTVNETVLGIAPHAGIDFYISTWLRIGPVISYHLISEFQEVMGNRKNYSGPVFCFNVGILL